MVSLRAEELSRRTPPATFSPVLTRGKANGFVPRIRMCVAGYVVALGMYRSSTDRQIREVGNAGQRRTAPWIGNRTGSRREVELRLPRLRPGGTK